MFRWLMVPLVGWVVTTLSGCGEPEVKCRVCVAVDQSGSMSEEERRACLGPLMLLADELRGHGSMVVWRYGATREKLFAGRPRDSDELLPLCRALIDGDDLSGSGTYLHLGLEGFANDLRLHGAGVPAVGMVLTDGEDGRPDLTRQEVARLAELPIECLLVGPVLPEFRESVEEALLPLGRRAAVVSQTDLPHGMATLVECLHEIVERKEREN